MRIRKHAQKPQTSCLPFQLPSPNNRCPRGSPPTRVCELNRSPWDVMSFTSEEMKEDDSGGETAGAMESIPSSNGTWEDDYKLERKDDISCSSSSSPPPMVVLVSGRERRDEEEMKSKSRKEGRSFICCNKTDGKGWKCKKEAKRSHSLCEHHLAQLKSYYTNNKSSASSSVSGGGGLKSDRTQAADADADADAAAANNVVYRGKMSSSKTPSSANYYYYTGFGPLWGKGRAESKRRDMELDSGPSSSTTTSSLSSHDDDDKARSEYGDDDGNVGKKKRTRKPLKTRSLKSLL